MWQPDAVAAFPPPAVLAAFGVEHSIASLLPGGQGSSWRAGSLVLKPASDEIEATWSAGVLSSLNPEGFHINRPVASSSGAWVVDGWTAYTMLPGEHDLVHRWADVIEVGAALNRALAKVKRPAFLDDRSGPWSIGDCVAWGEAPLSLEHDEFKAVGHELTGYVQPEDLASQVIHGDLSRNVLSAPGDPPAVIDFVPYWRPASFSLAIVVVDAVAWFGANPGLRHHLPEPGRRSLLARAALYRLVTSDLAALSMSVADRAQYLQVNKAAYEQLLPLVRPAS